MGSAGREYVPGQIHRSDRMASTGLYEDGKRGIRRLSEPELRLKDQDRDGVQAEVLYGILGSSTRMADPEAAVEMIRIYNDWLAEFCDTHPDRFAGLACIPSAPIDAAVSEVKRVVKRGGVRGLDVANTLDMPPLYDPYWNPLWDVVDESGLPLHFHTVGGRMPDAVRKTLWGSAWGDKVDAPMDFRVARAGFAVHISGFQIYMSTILMSHGLRRRARASSRACASCIGEGGHRLDPLHPRPHGPGVGGPVRGPRAQHEAERLLAAAVQGHLPVR